MKSSKSSLICFLGLMLVGVSILNLQFVQAASNPPRDVPGKGQGHEMGGKKGYFFVTASGNNPYITFHTKGNTTQESVFRVKFEKLIFFSDLNGDGKYDPHVDSAKNTIILSTLQWTTGDLISTGNNYDITLNATNPGVFDEFAIIVHFQNSTSNDTSNSLKFDIVIRNMQETAYNGGNYVALKHQLFIDFDNKKNGAEHKFMNGTGNNNNTMLVSSSESDGDAEAKFEWEEHAEINGTRRQYAVNGSGEDESQGNTRVHSIYLAFPKFANLTYDPTLSLVSVNTTIDGFNYILISAQLFIITGIIVWIKSRKITH